VFIRPDGFKTLSMEREKERERKRERERERDGLKIIDV
jgi:hypothetical protein